MLMLLATGLFWAAVGLIGYTYIGFPFWSWLRARIHPRPRAARPGAGAPSVSLIVAAYNEAGVIQAKIANSLALDYPRDRLEIIVASDGSDDGTDALVAACGAPEVRLLPLLRQGKNRTLNAAVAAAQGEILVFSDADSLLTPETLRHLAAAFADPEVGGVAGDYRHALPAGGAGGERAYWSIDRRLKIWHSQVGSLSAVSGGLYALRRSLYAPVPPGVTDDFFIAMQAPLARRRLVFEPRAVARGPIAESSRAEFRRKVRVITAGLRGVWAVRPLLNPFRHGAFALQLFSHKVLRRLMFLPLLVLLVTALLLWPRGWVYQLAALAQVALHGAAGLGWLAQPTRLGQWKPLSWPFYFDLVNGAAIVAVLNLLGGARHDVWVPQRSALAGGGGE